MNKKIIVSKLGSSLIADQRAGLHAYDIENYISAILSHDRGASHIFVVSGARASGIHRAKSLFTAQQIKQLTDKQLSGLGATTVFYAFEKALEKLGVAASSYPITHHLLDSQIDATVAAERESFMDVLLGNAQKGIASIINEADAMNDKELMKLLFGFKYEIDNDLLAAHIAQAVGADSLTLWKKEGGLRDEDGQYITNIHESNVAHYRRLLEGRASGNLGRGGPVTTLDALLLAARSGVTARAAGVNQNMTGVNVTKIVLG